MGPGTGGDRFKQFLTGQLAQKFMQVSLDRLHGLLQRKEHNDDKSQLTFAGEILGAHAMACTEIRVAQLVTQRFDKTDDMSGDAFNKGAHPYLN